MRPVLWLAAFFAAFIVESAILPRLVGGLAPSLTTAALILGIAGQRFWPGLAFAALAGVLRDIAAGGGVYAFTALGTFFGMQAFAAITQWEDPLARIGAAAAGLTLQPLLWQLGIHVVGFAFGTAASPLGAADISSRAALGEILFALAWFGLFVWRTLSRAAERRAHRLRHL